MTWRCHHCGAAVVQTDRVGRRDACLRCGADLHCCLNCAFYDRAYHNACREPQAEPQVQKAAGNFCDYFSSGPAGADRPSGADPAAAARARLDALFAKKP